MVWKASVLIVWKQNKSNQEMSNYNSISGPTMLHEFKILKISNKLRKILSSQVKTTANNQMGILELKNTISELKNLLARLISRMEMTEETVNLNNERIHSEDQRETGKKQKV